MVLTQTLCAINLATAVLANGMCCFYETRREETRKTEQQTAIRQTIHTEWERQRYLDMMKRQAEKDQLLSSKLQDKRRIQLMACKQASALSTKILPPKCPNQLADHRDQPQSYMGQSPLRQRSPNSCRSSSFSGVLDRPSLEAKTTNNAAFNNKHSNDIHYPRSPSNSYDCPERQLSSLMDECDDDDMEDVCIE